MVTRIYIIIALALTVTAAMAYGEEQIISIKDYRNSIERIITAVENNDTASAKKEAAILLNCTIRHGDSLFYPDGSVLKPISEADELSSVNAHAERLKALVAVLRENEPPADNGEDDGRNADYTLILDLKEQLDNDAIESGGDVAGLPFDKPEVPENVSGLASDIFEKIKEWIRKLMESLSRMWPDSFSPDQDKDSIQNTKLWVIIILIVTTGLLAAGAVYAYRRSRTGLLVTPVSQPKPSAEKDEDPLSRNTDEWEKYAAELIAAGSYRESVRAFYHAVLTTFYRRGLLLYRKGRTNWEYAYSLSPEVRMRPLFMDVTREFEKVWYGRKNASEEDVMDFSYKAMEIITTVRKGEKV